MAAAAAAVLRCDATGNPWTLRAFASLVEAEACRYASAASRPAENDLVRAFRGGAAGAFRGGATGATPSVAISEFLVRCQRCFRYDGSCYVLAAVFLTRFIRSRSALAAGILAEPATAHRLVSVAVLLGGKFAAPRHYERRVEVFDICSDRAILSSEMCPLELAFLRAVEYRLFVGDEEFSRFCGYLERGQAAERSCGNKKRKRKAEAGADEEPSRVRACLPPVVAS